MTWERGRDTLKRWMSLPEMSTALLLSLSVQVEISRHFNRRRQGPPAGERELGDDVSFCPLGLEWKEEEEEEPVGFCCHHRQPHTEGSFRQNEMGTSRYILACFDTIHINVTSSIS